MPAIFFSRTDMEAAGELRWRLVVVIGRSVFLRLKQVLARFDGLAVHQEFEFLHVIAPAEAVEEFKTRELGFIKGAFAVAGAKIKMIEVVGREMLDCGGHEEQTEAAIEPRKVVK